MLRLEVFFSCRALRTFAGCFSSAMETLPVKIQEFELKKATRLQKGTVECVVLMDRIARK